MGIVEVNVEGLYIAALLPNADDYKPMVLRKKFEQIVAVLAEQAYWLSWFESLDAMSSKLTAVKFKVPNRRKGEFIQTPMWVPGSQPSVRDIARFEMARKRARSKLYGKGSASEDDVVARALGGWAYDHELNTASKESIMMAAMGPHLFAYAKSKHDKSELDEYVKSMPVNTQSVTSSRL